MKLHDLRPARGAHTPKTRVGRGIAAGKGKTAGRGTKGQKSRTGSSIPAWFEGGQTPIHVRIPKLRGFRNRGKIEYEVVNLGRISQLVELGALPSGDLPGGSKSAKAAPITVNQEILRAAGLVSTLSKPMKVLGQGDVTGPLFVVADAFSKSAIDKIQAAGGSVQVIEVPTSQMAALVGEPAGGSDASAPTKATKKAEAIREAAPTKASRPTAKATPADKPAPKAGKRAPAAEASAPADEAPAPEASATTEASATADEAPAPEASAPTAEASASADETPAPEASATAEPAATPEASAPTPPSESDAATEGAAPDDAPKRARRKPAGDGGAA
jgi:large subunit ribosomal protein L15